MRQVEIPFLDSKKSLQISYTDKGLVSVSFKRTAPREGASVVRDPMGAKIKSLLTAYLGGSKTNLDLPIDWQNLPGTDFQKKVWKKMQKIPYGKVKTYGELAEVIGSPKAARAVGTACGKNHIPIIIPCHRIVSSTGIGGFSGGLDIKEKLLALEKITLQ